MSDNVINFPVAMRIGDRHCYGGQSFETTKELVDYLSDRDWRRVVQWESRHAAHLESRAAKRKA